MTTQRQILVTDPSGLEPEGVVDPGVVNEVAASGRASSRPVAGTSSKPRNGSHIGYASPQARMASATSPVQRIVVAVHASLSGSSPQTICCSATH